MNTFMICLFILNYLDNNIKVPLINILLSNNISNEHILIILM